MRYGIAHVAGRYPDRSVQQDFLTYGANAALTMGFSGIKLFVSPNYNGALSPTYRTDYPDQNFGAVSCTTPLQLIQTTPFNSVISNASFSVLYLNTWSFQPNSMDNFWINDATTTQIQTEYQQMYDYAYYLATNFVGKEFVIQNWEGDWAFLGAFEPTTPVPAQRKYLMRAILRARKEAIQYALRDAGTLATSKVVFAVEVNRVLDPYNERVHRDVIPPIYPERIGLSFYEAINGWVDSANQAAAEASIATLGQQVIDQIRKHNPYSDIYISEFGWPERQANFAAFNAGGLLQATVDLAIANGLTDCVGWQMFDNEVQEDNVTPRGYYMIDETGNYGVQGQYYIDNLL
jgi:hypothetical protein